MGYQVVEFTQGPEKRVRGVAYNSELFSTIPIEERLLLFKGYETLLKAAEVLPSLHIREIAVIDRATLLKEASYRHFADSLELRNSNAGAADAPDEYSRVGDRFKRFTAYRNDRRITTGHGLLPGTYATTEEDARNVRTGKEAVARYALPNPKPAVFRFTIAPIEKTKLRRGIVQPAFGQPGGGVEVFFVDGSVDNTVTGPDQIPDG
jgi:hypothetical protein